ncbi:CHAT domain-containing protein [Planobispora siamensis]|uniref:CHAT domain-containing protein n=1 Tax=Planobispora siamensis TaxID=936338 RepID=A0A8J3SHI6_9ACTN|nr:CHAT domain-containing protein [Planobispora siamensis]GIH89803.1 CHAT domain-containing protein [Planobispora siamensis]
MDATELLRLAEADPARLASVVTETVSRARAEGDLVLESIAERALGAAMLYLDGPDSAMRHLRAAMRLAERAGSAELAAEARIRLALVMNVRGRPRRAMREIDAAMGDLRGAGRARGEAQRAAIMAQLGHHDEAFAGFRAAMPVLRRDGDRVWLQRVLSNRGVIHGYRNEFGAAEADLREAERLCQLLDLTLSLGFVQQNLGWINAMRGDVPEALHYLSLAERCFRRLGAPLGELFTDRSQLLLSVGLVSEAREAAEEAVRLFEREHRQLGLPEARLLLARAAVMQGDDERARLEAQSAEREFARQNRAGWATLAHFVVLRSSVNQGRRSPATLRALERCAAALLDAGWPAAALEARLLVAQDALERGWSDRACALLGEAARARRRGPALTRARAWHATALLRLTQGNRRGARSAIRTALRVLDEHRATFGATDLRAHFSEYRVDLAELGLRMAFEEGSAARVLSWAEQGRASHLLIPPARPPDDPRLADALAELRATVRRIQVRRAAGQGPGRLLHRQITLEEDIRDYCRQSPASSREPTEPVPADQLAQALGDAVLVEFVSLDGMLHAITVVDGRVRLRSLGALSPITDLVERVPFALHRLARRHASPDSRAAAVAMLRHAAAELDAILFGPIAADLADRPLVLVPTGPLQSLAWSILPSCAGRPLSLSPSATLWHLAGRRRSLEGPVVAAAGPALSGARTEAEAVAGIHSASALVESAATVEAVIEAVDGARLAHLAAHGHLHPTNPLFSSLRFADGPLTVYDLEQLRNSPQIVILAACDSGRSVIRAGDELLGLSASLLARGARNIIASVVPIPDTETVTLMITLHEFLAAGHSAAGALARAQRQVAAEDTQAMAAAAAGFVSMGADCTLSAV